MPVIENRVMGFCWIRPRTRTYFSEQENVVDIQSQDVHGTALRTSVDARVRLETHEANFHQVFVDRVPPVGRALAEGL